VVSAARSVMAPVSVAGSETASPAGGAGRRREITLAPSPPRRAGQITIINGTGGGASPRNPLTPAASALPACTDGVAAPPRPAGHGGRGNRGSRQAFRGRAGRAGTEQSESHAQGRLAGETAGHRRRRGRPGSWCTTNIPARAVGPCVLEFAGLLAGLPLMPEKRALANRILCSAWHTHS